MACLLILGDRGGLPLALAQAAGYLTTTRMDPARYLAKFRARRAALLARSGDPLYTGTVATAWSVALERLEADLPATVDLLRFSYNRRVPLGRPAIRRSPLSCRESSRTRA